MSNIPNMQHSNELADTEASHRSGQSQSATPKPRAGEHTPTSAELVASVLSLISEDIRVAAALDIEAAIKLRLLAERDLLRERERELVDLAQGVVTAYKDVLLRSTVEQHLYDCARALIHE